MQHLGLYSFLILVLGLTFTLIKKPAGLEVTFSQRVANDKKAELLYSALFIVALSLLLLFFIIWFVPKYNLQSIFLVFAVVAVFFQIACTFFPERGGWLTAIHRVLTGISGVALLPMVVVLATAKSISDGLNYIIWLGLMAMIVLLAIALKNQKGFKYALLLQIGYYALFFAIILLVTYQV